MKPLLIDCSFDQLPEFGEPAQALAAHAPGFGYAEYLQEKMRVIIIEHIAQENEVVSHGVPYHFFKSGKRRPFAFRKMAHFIRKKHPDVVLVQGLIFPLEVILLRLQLNHKIIFLAQHHGEVPGRRFRRLLGKIADHIIRGYLFTSLDNAALWVSAGIIAGYHKCYEVPEASTSFERQDKVASRKRLQLKNDETFLWVGRLNADKDPLTVLNGFNNYISLGNHAKLIMIYQENELLPAIQEFIFTHPCLMRSVALMGKMDHNYLPFWYSASDFFLAGSHHEGSGYALIEAMSCGCIPVVTNIPSFRKLTDFGRYGFLYEPGNASDLLRALLSLKQIDRENLSLEIREYFVKELSFRGVAEKLYQIFNRMLSK